MKVILTYLILILGFDLSFIVLLKVDIIPLQNLEDIVSCGLLGGIGGVAYCLRGVYLNACVRKSWDKDWLPWYFIRPIVSHICGAISYIFLRGGLLVLEAEPAAVSTNMGFLALAFIAGLNVDKFISKIEDVAQATWGIEKSRTSKREE